MSNIRVDIDYTIKDGTEIKFRSPVDCSQITGMIVYYPGADGNIVSKVFALADAHGSNVGDIDHLFAEDVVVKVILDVTKGMAFVQNADTNAYLEAQFAIMATAPHAMSGEVIAVTDSSYAPLLGLKLYGKTVQNGTPTPDAPVPLESVGASGSIGVTVTDGLQANAQTITTSTPNGLAGLPMPSNMDGSGFVYQSDYVDANGNPWITDYIDWARGVRVQRFKRYTATETSRLIKVVNGNGVFMVPVPADRKLGSYCLCSHYNVPIDFDQNNYNNPTYTSVIYKRISSNPSYLFVVHEGITTIEEYNAWLAENPIEFIYELETPIETPLSAEELAQYAALHTNEQNTTVFNDGGADMEIRYCTQNTAVPMNLGGKAGSLLTVDEHGCVTTKKVTHHIQGRLSSSGWYRVGVLKIAQAQASTAAARMVVGGNYNNNDAGLHVIDFGFDYFYGYLKNALDSHNTSHFSNVRLSRISNWHVAVDVYYRRDSGNDVHIEIHPLQGVFEPSYFDTANLDGEVAAELDLSEWQNPPMIPGVEYRTTERLNGKPVYAYANDFGALPVSSSKVQSVRIINVEKLLPVEVATAPYTCPAKYADVDLSVYAYVSSESTVEVRITTATHMSDSTAIAILKYTKTTD